MSDHTPGAIKAAEAITGGTYGDTTRYKTAYGMKTVMGVADIIDRKTAAPALLKALKYALRLMPPSAEHHIIHSALDKAEGRI